MKGKWVEMKGWRVHQMRHYLLISILLNLLYNMHTVQEHPHSSIIKYLDFDEKTLFKVCFRKIKEGCNLRIRG